MKHSPFSYFALSVLLLSMVWTQDYPIRINEIQAVNSSTLHCAETDDYPDWFELFNSGSEPVDIGGWYVTDDPDEPLKYQIPGSLVIQPGQYTVMWADGLGTGNHVGFRLSSEGEYLGLFQTTGDFHDGVEFPFLMPDISYGRHSENTAEWGYFESPTPEAGNTGIMYSGIALTPEPEYTGGFYSESVVVTFPDLPGDFVTVFSADGSEPNTGHPMFSGSLTLTETTVLRFRSFAPGMLPGPVITETYLINEDVHLPVVSLATDPDNFFDNEIGIYVTGTNGITGYCTSIPMNLNQDWERPVNVEFLHPDEGTLLNQGAGVKIFGGCSRTRYPQKSLALYARGEYGASSFDCRLFENRPIDEYQSFILRSSADDQPFTMFRDAAAQSLLFEAVDVDVQAYRPVAVFLNGEYWGIHNLREKLNEHYPAGNFDLDAGNIDILRRNPTNSWDIVAGSADHYNAMMDFVSSSDLSLQASYDYVKTQMDTDEYINYQSVMIYLGMQDWPGNNIKFWRAQDPPHDRWRWMTYDMDWTLMYPDTNDVILATDPDCGCSWPNPPWSTLLFRSLLENNEFRDRFIQRYAFLSTKLFAPERVITVIDSLQEQIAPEIPRHIERWGGQTFSNGESWMSPTFNSLEQWENNVQVMRDFAVERSAWSQAHIINYFGLGGLCDLSIAGSEGGRLFWEDLEIPGGQFSGFCFQNAALNLAAEAVPGFQFEHFEVTGAVSQNQLLVDDGAVWHFLDTGTALGTNWAEYDPDHLNWQQGPAQLGYGDGDETTVVSYGPDSNNKYPTTYFKHHFNVSDPENISSLLLELVRDDGAVVYLNGSEVWRVNLPDGPVTYATWALDYVAGEDEDVFFPSSIDPDFLIEGENTLAVEIHQSSGGSSDISFDLRLTAMISAVDETITVGNPHLQITPGANLEITAVFEPVTVPPEVSITINEINYHSNDDFPVCDWIELTNSGDASVNLINWHFLDSADDHDFVVPADCLLEPGEFMVLCQNLSEFESHFPEVENILGSFEFGLSGNGELIRLLNPDGAVVDSVRYDDGPPWPAEADGSGPTLELMNPAWDNGLPGSWQSSNGNGTPGSVNSVFMSNPIGDLDSSGNLDVIDLVILVGFILEEETPEPWQILLADAVPDGSLDVLDLVALVGIILE